MESFYEFRILMENNSVKPKVTIHLLLLKYTENVVYLSFAFWIFEENSIMLRFNDLANFIG